MLQQCSPVGETVSPGNGEFSSAYIFSYDTLPVSAMVSPAEESGQHEQPAPDCENRIRHPRYKRRTGKPGERLVPNASACRRGGRADRELSAWPDGELRQGNITHASKVRTQPRTGTCIHGRNPTKVRVQPGSISRSQSRVCHQADTAFPRSIDS